ncbi:hypothetical protein [Pseudolactococcus raffinolactis]|uniref:hypothetical protein n=1 Tax=Pseudolactococcus raffinolactis TaxID=1366 RepID=UPI0028981213|nr:hypothetical protein [Lactococcus raffinolactis]
MTYDVAILSVIVFIASMVCLEKNHVPKIVKTVSMLKLVPFCLLAILVGMGSTILTHLLYFVLVVTIMSACLIFWRYHKHTETWDKKIVKENKNV